ncbi:MAG: M48 family metallopeptidase [Chloroflexi bacterium]|nr:M48 family metallopeptidase [Chloroflexota bacterium]
MKGSAYFKLPVYWLAGIAILTALLGWAHTVTISPATSEVLLAHRETLETQEGKSLIPPASEIDLVEGDWVQAARLRQKVGFINLGFSVLVNIGLLIAFLWTGYSARLRDLYRPIARSRTIQLALYAITFLVLVALFNLPISYLTSFYLPHLFQLSTITADLWVRDFLLDLGVSLVVSVPVFLAFYWLLNRFPRTWWLLLTALLIPFIIFVNYVWPLTVDPLFNTYEPLEKGVVREQTAELAARAGVAVADIYRVDMSRRTLEGNAFVSGLGASKRIVIGDNLLDHFTPEEVVFIVGHELGHYVLQHRWLGVAGNVIEAFLTVLIIWRLLPWFVRRWGRRWGITAVGDVATYPLIALVLLLFPLISAPASNGFSRYIEHQADAYAVNITEDPGSGITSLTKLGYQNLSVPQPPAVIEFWFYSHPSIIHRIQFFETCHLSAEQSGGEPGTVENSASGY